MRIQYQHLTADITRLPPGATTLDCPLPTILTVFSGEMTINGKPILLGRPRMLPSGRAYMLSIARPSTVALLVIPKITSFQFGGFKVGI